MLAHPLALGLTTVPPGPLLPLSNYRLDSDQIICNVTAVETKDLDLPSNLVGYSLVVKGNSEIGATTINKAVAVGGDFGDSTVDDVCTVGTAPGSGENFVNYVTTGIWDFKTTLCEEDGQGIPFDWAHFETIADQADDSGDQLSDYRVVVIDNQRTPALGHEEKTVYTMENFTVNGQVGESIDAGKTLVVFRGPGTIVLAPRKTDKGVVVPGFGPSVLAPYSKVVLDGALGFVDGFIIAKQLTDFGDDRIHLKIHGNTYTGPITSRLIDDTALSPPPPSLPPPQPPEPASPAPSASPASTSAGADKTKGTAYDDPHVRSLSGRSYYMHGVGVFDYASAGGVESQVYMCPFKPCTENMAAKGECLTFIVAVGVKAGDHKIILRGNAVTVDGKEMSEDEWEGGHSNIPMAISPVGRRVTNHQVKRVHHSELQSCRPDGDSSDWLWHNCTKVGWNIVTPELSLNIGVLGPFEEGWLKEEVSTRTFNLGVSQVRDEPSVRGIVNGDVNGLFQPAGEEYSTGKNAAYNVNQIPQVTAHNVGPAKSIFPENMRKMMDARCGASRHMRLTLAAAATASDMVDLRKRP
jgi:hypothetical protein